MKSIQARLSLGLISVLLVVGLGLAQLSLWLFEHALQDYLHDGLRDESETLLMAISRGPQGLQLDEQRLPTVYQRPLSGRYFRVDLAGGPWRSRSLWDMHLAQPAAPGLQRGLRWGSDGQVLLVLRSDYRRLGQDVSITVAQDYTPVQDSFRRVGYIGLGLGLLGLVLILILQRMTVTRSLRPLERTRQQIAQLQKGERTELDTRVPAELAALVAQVNHLLQHTEASLNRSRNALGNLGHALKTPMAVLLNLVKGPRLDADPGARRVLQEQLGLIEQRLVRELARARLVGDALPGRRFECDRELPALFATLDAVHGGHLQLSWAAPKGLRLPWDRDDLLELLGNLLDNACKWADATVELQILVKAQHYLLIIDDDGPGIAESDREQVLQRGSRLDEQTRGHGLGLGIVRDIVAGCGGQLWLLESPAQGLRVQVELPGGGR